MQPSSVVIYSIVIRSFSTLFPFQKGKNEGNISKNNKTKNDATSNPESWELKVESWKFRVENYPGAAATFNFQFSIFNFYVGDKYATLSERWGTLTQVGAILHRIKSKFRAKRQASHCALSWREGCPFQTHAFLISNENAGEGTILQRRSNNPRKRVCGCTVDFLMNDKKCGFWEKKFVDLKISCIFAVCFVDTQYP